MVIVSFKDRRIRNEITVNESVRCNCRDEVGTERFTFGGREEEAMAAMIFK
jgi:hypothetical protein